MADQNNNNCTPSTDENPPSIPSPPPPRASPPPPLYPRPVHGTSEPESPLPHGERILGLMHRPSSNISAFSSSDDLTQSQRFIPVASSIPDSDAASRRTLGPQDLKQKKQELQSIREKIHIIESILGGDPSSDEEVPIGRRELQVFEDMVKFSDYAAIEHIKNHESLVAANDEENGRTALHIAAACGSLEVVKALLAAGAAPDATDNNNETARAVALKMRQQAVVDYFDSIECGEEPMEEPMTPRRKRHLEKEAIQNFGLSVRRRHTVVQVPSMYGGMSNNTMGSMPTPVCSVPFPSLLRESSLGAACSFTLSGSTTSPRVAQVRQWVDDSSFVVIMVGLPGRGKTFMCKRLTRWLAWNGIPSRIFSASLIRREMFGSTADDFDAESMRKRDAVAAEAVNRMLAWVKANPGGVVFFDSTNATRDRRSSLAKQLGIAICPENILFMENICDDPKIIEFHRLRHIDVSKYSPDEVTRLMSFWEQRDADFHVIYQSMSQATEPNVSFVRITNFEHIEMVNVKKEVQRDMVLFIQSLFPMDAYVYLTASGESVANVAGRLGGDDRSGESTLTPTGERYALALRYFMDMETDHTFNIFASTHNTARSTAQWLGANPDRYHVKQLSFFDDIRHGECEGMTESEVQREFPNTYRKILADPNEVAWLRGESYRDLVQRMEGGILQIGRSPLSVLVVSHIAPTQVLHAFLDEKEPESAPNQVIRRHHVYKFIKHNHSVRCSVVDLTPVMEQVTDEMLDTLRRYPDRVDEVLHLLYAAANLKWVDT
eukprot:PhM_4_TR10532/c0_g1_i1/m.49024/K19029/PFKFB2; 6-phosphofructo-2-kinase / fructose-2,6-biphosphatase 2